MTKNDLEKRVSSLEKENKRLGMTAKKYRHLMQNIPDIVYVLDKCIFRLIPATNSAPFRPPIPEHSGHLFRYISATLYYNIIYSDAG